MDHLFWRVHPKMDDHQFVWILWYIWKERNNKVFNNIDVDPRKTLKFAEIESILWAEAQVLMRPRSSIDRLGSWKRPKVAILSTSSTQPRFYHQIVLNILPMSSHLIIPSILTIFPIGSCWSDRPYRPIRSPRPYRTCCPPYRPTNVRNGAKTTTTT